MGRAYSVVWILWLLGQAYGVDVIETTEAELPSRLLRLMLGCFASGDVQRVPEVVSPVYCDHQSENEPRPHGPELFCRIVQGARRSFPQLEIEVVAVRAIGRGPAESHARWHWTDTFGERRVRATVDQVRVEDGQVVEHWGWEVPA